MQRRTLLASLTASALLARTARAAADFMTTPDNQRLAYLDRGTGSPVVFRASARNRSAFSPCP